MLSIVFFFKIWLICDDGVDDNFIHLWFSVILLSDIEIESLGNCSSG